MDLNLGETIKVFIRTLPYAVVRTAVYLAGGLATLLYLLLLFGLAALFSAVGGNVGGGMAFLVVVVGLGGGLGLIHLARNWILHILKAGHVAVATAYIAEGRLPEGESQYQVGKRLVMEQFVDVNVLFVIDALVKASIRAINRLIENVANLLPLPGMNSLAQWTGRIVNMAVTYIDETVLSYSLYKGDKNVWQSAVEGIVLYAQSYRVVLKNAVIMALLSWASYGLLVILLGIPCWPLAWSLGSGGHSILQAIFFLVPFVLGYFLKLGLVNPFVMISVLITFHRHAVGQPISSEWQERIESVSEKFRELRQKAEDFARQRKSAVQTATTTPGGGRSLEPTARPVPEGKGE